MPSIADIFQQKFQQTQAQNQPPPASEQTPPIVDLFAPRPEPPTLPDSAQEQAPPPREPTAPSQQPAISQDVINQANQLQAALSSQQGVLAGLGQSFGVNIPTNPFFGGIRQAGTLEALLGPALSQIQGMLDPSLLGIPEIAQLFNPLSFQYQRPETGFNPFFASSPLFGGGLQGGIPKLGTGFQSQQPNPGNAITALNAFLNGGASA